MTPLEKIQHLQIGEYDYPLPDPRIAKHPLAERERCKLLAWRDGHIDDRHFSDVPAMLPPDCMLIYNNTRVINARLRFRKESGSTIEVFCLEPAEPADYALMFQTTRQAVWHCLVGNSKRWKQGSLQMSVDIGAQKVTLTASRVAQHGKGWDIRFDWDGDVTFATLIDAAGVIPIPPYLNRDTEESDATDYQTVYSHIDGSVAAPTAGLHFTDALLEECDRRGIRRRELTLHVGAGTFRPVQSDTIGEHDMHHELFAVGRDLLLELAEQLRQGKPVVAVGTTSVRTLESLYYVGNLIADGNPSLTVGQWMPYDRDYTLKPAEALEQIAAHIDSSHAKEYVGSTQLMIAPGFRYRIVDGMITNFHQPQSTLLLLVSAFVGETRWRDIYDHALQGDYRFLSYGDACLLLR